MIEAKIIQKIVWNHVKGKHYARLLLPEQIVKESFLPSQEEVVAEYKVTDGLVEIRLKKKEI